MTNGLPNEQPQPGLPLKLPGRGADWANGLIGTALVAFLGLQQVKVGNIQVDQDGNEKDIDTILTKIDEVDAGADETRKVFMKKMNQLQKDLDEIKALLEKETP